jgi:O-Antigen ligase
VTVALAWAAVVALAVRGAISFAPLDVVAVASLTMFVLWSLASVGWSDDDGATLLSTERALVYAAALAAAVIVLRASAYRALVVGVWAGTTLVCGYAALTRMYPNRFAADAAIAGRRLAQPVGYWNSLGLLAAVGIIVAVGLVAATRSRALAAVAAAGVVPLAVVLYLTFSRGAAIVLAAGALVALALDPRRLRLASTGVVVVAAPAAAVVEASRLAALSTKGAPAAEAADAGATLFRTSLLAAAVAAAAALLLVELTRRLAVPRAARVAFAAVFAVVVLVAAGGASATYGSPPALAKRAWHSFTAKPKQTKGNLNNRLLTLSNNGRVALWRVAWNDFRAHPLRGSGAGTYYAVWMQHRPVATQVRNAHSLYLETLAELGLPGIVLLALGLLAPLAAAVRARGEPLVAAAAGGYVAFLLHAAFDWDWQLPGVTLAPVLLGAALLAAARDHGRAAGIGNAGRIAAAAVLVVVAAVAGFALLGNRAVAAAESATAAQRWTAAESHARRAASLQPWSSQPWRVLGEAQLEQGKLAAARTSFRAGLANSPRDWLLWLDLALASRRADRPTVARHALALNPRSTEIARIRPFLGL